MSLAQGEWVAGLAAALLLAGCSGATAQEQKQGLTRAVTVVAPEKPDLAGRDNAAGVSVDILPSDEFAVGSKVEFRVRAKKPGYVVLVDVDSSGKVSQRYPNLYSMALPAGASEKANLIQPGRPVLIPNRFNPFAAFEYVAEPPVGQGLIFVLVSPKPVHVVDLPDVPPETLRSGEAIGFLIEAAKKLRIADRDRKGPLADPEWSFAAKAYSITP